MNQLLASPAGEPAVSPDSSFSIAFALGWETASLFRGGSFDAGRVEDGHEDALPGLAGLSAQQSTELAVDLIDADLRKLGERLAVAAPVETKQIDVLRAAANMKTDDRGLLQQAVRELHLDVLGKLTAADLRLGRAYGLGHALADTCLLPGDRDSFDLAFGTRLVNVKDWLADLASSFPPHSSRAVVLSLRAWEAWAAEPHLDGKPLVWSTHGAGVREALHRQGELWRDLLGGDKNGEDMLDTNHYLRAASSLVAAMTSTLWRFARPLRILLMLAVPLFFAGIALFVFSDTAVKTLGAIIATLGAVGITGAGLRTRLGKVTTQLQSRLWGAELDMAIAEAVLLGPTGWDATVRKITVPPTGTAPKVSENAAMLHTFRGVVAAGRKKDVRELLSADVKFAIHDDGTGLSGPDEVVRWVLQEQNASWIAAEPRKVEAVGTGALVTERDDCAEVWRIQEGKVRHWASYADAQEARTAAQQNGAGS